MKPARLACLILFLAPLVFGQSNPASRLNHPPAASGLNFALAVTYGSGGSLADSVAVADVNGDGKPDLLVTNGGSSTVGVLLGNGDGTFQPARSYGSGGINPYSVAVADVNGDGKPDLLVSMEGNESCAGGAVGVLLGNGDGTFQTAVTYCSGGQLAVSVAVADVNGDGKPDLVVANSHIPAEPPGLVGVLLGNGDGTFQTAVTYSSGGDEASSVVVADVNGDGHPDVVVSNDCSDSNCINGSVGILLGNGDGTFQTAVTYGSGGFNARSVAVADANGDGKLDLLIANYNGLVGVLLGNGDGTFQTAVTYGSGGVYASSVVVGDVNGDGKLDVAVANFDTGTVGVLLGDGDGTFQTVVTYGSGGFQDYSVAVADVNGDGKPDLLVANFCNAVGSNCTNGVVGVLINTSLTATTTSLTSSLNPSNFGQAVTFTATVTAQQGFYKGTPTGAVSFFDTATSTNLGTSSLNSSGVAALQISTLGPSTNTITATYSGDANFASSVSPVLSQVVLGAAAKFSTSTLNFGEQTVGITSAAQTVTLTNTGDIPLNFTSITMGGLDPRDFSQTNNCGSSLAGQASCTISITFTPTKTSSRNAAVVFMDNAPSKVQRILLAGLGVLPSVSFSPTSLAFPRQVIYTTSLVQTVRLNNFGLGVLNISTIGASGPFRQTNDCGSTVGPGSGCTITVTFRPTTIGTLTAALSVRDNAPASPQKAGLSGTGTAVELTPIAIGFGNQPVGTTSLAKTITLSNKSHATVNIASIAITGSYRDDFAETNTCGTSVASGASCFIKVKFTPRGKGSRTAAVSITDDGGGSPQTVGLAGTGT